MIKIKSHLLSTNSPKLTLCSSLSKDKLSDGLGVVTMLSRLKSTHVFKQELKTYSYYLPLWGLLMSPGSWAVERQNNQVKHYTSHSFISYYSRAFAKFFNKTQSFLIWPFLVSHLCYFWILNKARMMYTFSLLLEYVTLCSLFLSLHLISLCEARRWGDSSNILANICCIVKTWI